MSFQHSEAHITPACSFPSTGCTEELELSLQQLTGPLVWWVLQHNSSPERELDRSNHRTTAFNKKFGKFELGPSISKDWTKQEVSHGPNLRRN